MGLENSEYNVQIKNYDNGYGFEEFTFMKHIERVRVRYILRKIELIEVDV